MKLKRKLPIMLIVISILLLIQLTVDNFASILKKINLASKNDTDKFVKNNCFDEKLKNYSKGYWLRS